MTANPRRNESGSWRAGSGDWLPPASDGGWALLAILVTVTALGIGALALSVVGIRRHQKSERELEKRQLAEIGRAMRSLIMEETRIPHPTNMMSSLAGRLALAETGGGSNHRGNPRIVMEDPELGLGVTGTNRLPYTQDSAGSRSPRGARLLVVSSLGRGLPDGLVSGANLTSVQFSNLWNVAEGEVPPDWDWDGDPYDLCVERVPLSDLFVTLVLRYREDSAAHRGRYLVSQGLGTNGHTLLPSTPFTNAFLRGSQLALFGVNGALQFREVVQDEGRIYTCQDGVWRLGEGTSGSRLGPAVRHPTPEEFADALIAFLDPDVALWPNNSGSTRWDMFVAITNFLATGAYRNQEPGMGTAQSALVDVWVDFTGAQPNKP